MAICIFSIYNSVSLAEETEYIEYTIAKDNDNSHVIQGDVFEWRYKMENGQLYRRLINLTTGEWVGDWEPVP